MKNKKPLDHDITTKTKNKSSRIPRFYRLSVEQRLAYLARNFNLSDEELNLIRRGTSLDISHAINMVENTIGIFGLPLGLSVNFLIDGRDFLAPMAIEEASVIAGASKAAMLVRQGGGFITSDGPPIMIGQVQLLDVANPEDAIQNIMMRRGEIINLANDLSPRMVKRGGGVIDIEPRILDINPDGNAMMVVHLHFNVCEAMGANAVNAACEAVGPLLSDITGGATNMHIVSNLADQRITKAEFSIPFKYLETNGDSGEAVAQRVVAASRMAQVDPHRAATHNKGIFNGICAAAIALGQDYRAIEAGGHAYAARDGQYRGLSQYWIADGQLKGSMAIPMQVGLVGGAVKSHPAVKTLIKISRVKNSNQLARLLTAVGLGQNFAACLALCTDGIQKGHMSLHARSVAISAGVPTDQVARVALEMIRRGEIKVAVAEEIARSIQKLTLKQPSSNVIHAAACGKIILFGEHATVYDYPGIISAIDIDLKVKINKDSDGPRFVHPKFRQAFPIPDSDIDVQNFTQAANLALERYGLSKEPIAIMVESDIIPGVGMGSSAAFAIALLRAFRQYKGLSVPVGFTQDLFDEAQQLESIFHGKPSGMDAATILSGGVLWFRKSERREMIPIHIPSPMRAIACIVERGARTVDMVQKVSKFRSEFPERAGAIFDEIGNITVDAGIALGTADTAAMGELMSRNQECLARLGVSTPALDDAVDFALRKGALGAKLTGSGGGGAIVILPPQDRVGELLEALAEKYRVIFPFTIGIH